MFKFDPDYDENEKRYAAIAREILGESESEEEGDGEGEGKDKGEGDSSIEEESSEEEEEEEGAAGEPCLGEGQDWHAGMWVLMSTRARGATICILVCELVGRVCKCCVCVCGGGGGVEWCTSLRWWWAICRIALSRPT